MKRIRVSNLLMFVSHYMMFTVFSGILSRRFDLPVSKAGSLYFAFLFGLIVAGPFMNYLLDHYRRKSLCLFGLTLMLVTSVAFFVSGQVVSCVMLAFLNGIGFGIASSALITLSIDLSASEDRTRINISLARTSLVGMMCGIILGGLLMMILGAEFLIVLIFLLNLLAILSLATVRVPFRAPIGMPLLSFDRFFLPRSWPLALSVFLMVLAAGLLLPLMSRFGMFFAFPYMAFGYQFVFLLLGSIAAIFASSFLKMFIRMADHCERTTANVTHLLSWETGMASGFTLCAYFVDASFMWDTFWVSGVIALFAVLFFFFVAYPYYKSKKVR